MKIKTPLLIGTMILAAFLSQAQAQISTMPFRQFQGTWTELVGGTIPASFVGSVDDGYWTIPIGFTFNFAGIDQTVCYAGTNGYLTFGSGSTGFGTGAVSILYGSQGAIAALSTDGYCKSLSNLTYSVSGIAPNRILTVQWLDWYRFGGSVAESYSYQVKLYETSNKVDIVYGPWMNVATFNPQVGLRGLTTSMVDISNRSVTNGINTWPTSVAGTVNTASCAVTPTLFPPSGLTYSWGCNIPAGSADLTIVDQLGTPLQYIYSPGTIFVNYTVSYPLATAYDIPVRLDFYRIGDPSGTPVYTTGFTINKPVGVFSGTEAVGVDLTPGYYRIVATFTMLNNCDMTDEYMVSSSILSLAPGTQPCIVWPGDVNNDAIVNYGDLSALNRYIRNANLRTLWLTGPARYLPDAETNPLTYLEWKAQVGVPWFTSDGCYMDCDGNGVINNFDYLAIKLNMFRMKGGGIGKNSSGFTPESFDMDQNYPNPFNPSTTIRFSAPERSTVYLVVTDMLGREAATLTNDEVTAGVHTVSFDGSYLQSGSYIAMVRMVGMTSGLTYTKSIKMVLNK